MNKTKIEWTLNPDGTPGYTWNPITGCLNGCEYCYARKLANTRLRERYLANKNAALPLYKGVHWDIATDPFYPRFWPERLEQPLKCKKPAGIFVCNMGDLFGIGIPEQWTHSVMNFIERCPQHRFYLLTKQPQNLAKFSPFPDNCYVGVSVTNTKMYHHACYWLREIEAQIKYISFEPLLERILPNTSWPWRLSFQEKELWNNSGGVSWLIIGAQTKPTVMPKIEWVREIVEACDKAGVKVFLKDSLRPLLTRDVENMGTWEKQEDDSYRLKLRQEIPNA